MSKITAIIPTLNEEIHIEEAIASVSFADEIIVIDSFSSDNTVQLAKKHNVKIIQREFDDFSSQKNYAIAQASHHWIYILDADERVTPQVRAEILKAVKSPNGNVGFFVRRSFYFMGKNLQYGGCQRDKVLRLFLKDFCQYQGLVHETIVANGPIGFFKHKIDHFSYKNYNHYISKMNLYAELRAKEYFKQELRPNPFHFVIKPIARFCIHYLIRFGFLDLYPGFVWARVQAYGVFARYAKLWLLRKKLK